jgi:cell wall-associated NlpC family hydrolase
LGGKTELKHLGKSFVLSCAFVGIGFIASTQAHAASPTPVKVQVNDELVRFPDAQPFIDQNLRTQVPIRLVSEKMGYKVDYAFEGRQVKVKISNLARVIELKTGENQATVNGNKVSLDTNAMFTEGRTYVPVRFISESLGSKVQWDNKNAIAIVAADGKYHAPAYVPQVLAASVSPAVTQTQVKAQPAPPQAVPGVLPIVGFAKQFLGVPYVWGGSTPSGFDCSGFLQYIYGKSGIPLPRTSNDMFNTGSSVTVAQLKVGDLVFFSDSKRPPTTHAGMYIGNNQFISATSSSGIKIDDLYSSYWGSRFIGAKRVL